MMAERSAEPAVQPLPALRQELTLHAGPPGGDGAPTWSLQDPVRNAFFRIDWPTFEILSRWSLGDAQAIVDALNAAAPLELETGDVLAVLHFLVDNQLLRADGQESTERFIKRRAATRHGFATWLLHHYLFFRLPLVRPNAWLKRWLPAVEVFFRPRFYQITGLVAAFGLLDVFRQWDGFKATLIDTLSWQGAASYAVALALVKLLHELGHGFAARRYGCRVPTMGVAFLVMWPVAYTDVNDVWTLSERRQRLVVGAAGMITETVIAAWATLAWVLLPDGTLRGLAFFLATVSWISGLAVNASPFMRFDGYFLLSDGLDFPNLHGRAFALARWDLRERLFALGEDPPEYYAPLCRRALVAFAWAVWLYRLMLFLGIAAMVYYLFFKALGLFLFAVEIVWFVFRPLWSEVQAWRERSAAIRASRRARKSAWLLAGIVVAGLLPWNFQVGGQGILRSARHFPLFAPGTAQVAALPVAEGQHVEAGSVLVELATPEIRFRRQQAAQRVDRLGWQVQVAGFDDALRARQLVTREELATAGSEQIGAAREQERYVLVAPFAGVLRDRRADLGVGEWVSRNEPLAVLVDPSAWQVETFLSEREVTRIAVGGSARFYPETRGLPSLALDVSSIEADATRHLDEPLLASLHGGEVMVRERKGQLIPEQAVYRVVLKVHDPVTAAAVGRVQRGQVVIYGRPKTLLTDVFRSALAVLIRESAW